MAIAVIGCLTAATVTSATSVHRTRNARLPSSFTMEQDVTIDLEDPKPASVADVIVSADEHRGLSRPLGGFFGEFLSRVRTSPARASRRAMASEFPATVKLGRSASLPTSLGGSAMARTTTSVTATITCNFMIYDPDESLWDFTYEARIFDPGNAQIKYKTAWANDKVTLGSTTSVSLADAAEGTYTCKVKWWADASYVGEEQATKTLVYQRPAGESTAERGWLMESTWNGTNPVPGSKYSIGAVLGARTLIAKAIRSWRWWPATDVLAWVGHSGPSQLAYIRHSV
jgi:hypothetical protein